MTMSVETDIGRALGTDCFLLRSELTEDEAGYLDRTRKFVEEEVLPVMPGYWERAELPLDLARRLGELGLVGDGIEGYGCPPMSTVAAGLIEMELSRGDGSLGVLLGVQAGLAMRSIAPFGSEEQKQRWLPPMARMEALGAFALTEPEHGSDSVALETTARQESDEYVIDGGQALDRQRVARRRGGGAGARHRGRAGQGVSGRARHAGIQRAGDQGQRQRTVGVAGPDRVAWRAGPVSARLPGANPFRDTGKVLASTRLTCAFAALGHAVGLTMPRSPTAASAGSSASR